MGLAQPGTEETAKHLEHRGGRCGRRDSPRPDPEGLENRAMGGILWVIGSHGMFVSREGRQLGPVLEAHRHGQNGGRES